VSVSTIKKWNLTIESPTKFMRVLEDILHDDLHYPVNIKKPELRQTAIEGTASFEGVIRGKKSYQGRSNTKIVLGIILMLIGVFSLPSGSFMAPVGVILLIVGIVLLVKSGSLTTLIIDIIVEGESYKAGAGREIGKEKDKDTTERVGIISDVRLTARKKMEGHYDNKIQRLLDLNYDFLTKKVETEIIPRFKLPDIAR